MGAPSLLQQRHWHGDHQDFCEGEEAKRCVFGYIEGIYNTTRTHSSLNWQSPRAFRCAFEAQRLAATMAARAVSDNIIIFNREPSPPGEDMTESMSANQQNILRSMNGEMSATQAPRTSL